MKKLILILMLLLIASQAQATFTGQDYIDKKTYLGSGNKLLDPLYLYIVDAVGADTVGKSFFYFIPGTEPDTTKGYTYFNDLLDALVVRTSSGWSTLEAGGDFASLDEGYNGGYAIDVDTTGVTLDNDVGDGTILLILTQDDTDNDPDVISIANASNSVTSVSIDIDGTAGFDIQGTSDSWSISIAGVFDGEALTGVTHSQSIIFDTNGEIAFGDAGEEVSMVFTSDTITWATDSTVATMDFGDVDDLTGINNIAFDAAAGSITLDGTTPGWDLTIEQTGTVDSSLILSSDGSVADALSLITTDVLGSIKIDSGDNLDINVADNVTIDIAGGSMITTLTGGNFDVDATDAKIWLDGGIAAVDAIDIDATSGGFDMDVALSISLKSTEDTHDSIELVSTAGGIDITAAGAGGEDIDIANAAGSVNISAGEDDVAAMILSVTGGGSSAINIWADEGTGASATGEHDASVQLHSDDGGIGLLTESNIDNAIRIEADGGVNEYITISSVKGTGPDTITLTSTLGGIAITTNAAGKDVVVSSVLGSIHLKAEENAADAILLEVDKSNSTTLRLLATTGTSVAEDGAAIQLSAILGGIGIQSDANLDDAIVLRADGGAAAEITIQNEQGTTADSIELLSDAGGIVLTAAKPVVVTYAFELAYVLVPNGPAYTVLAANSGHVHLIPDQGADITLDLPAETTGLRYKFVYVGGAADAQDWLIDSESNTNFYIGGVVQHDEDGELTIAYYSDGDSNSILGVLTPECGTEIEIWCDGVHWYVTGTVISATNTGVTFSD